MSLQTERLSIVALEVKSAFPNRVVASVGVTLETSGQSKAERLFGIFPPHDYVLRSPTRA